MDTKQLLVKEKGKLKNLLQELKQAPVHTYNDSYLSLIKEIEGILEQLASWKLENTWANSSPRLECCTTAKEYAIDLNKIANSHGVTANLFFAIRTTINNIETCMHTHTLEIPQKTEETANKQDNEDEEKESRTMLELRFNS